MWENTVKKGTDWTHSENRVYHTIATPDIINIVIDSYGNVDYLIHEVPILDTDGPFVSSVTMLQTIGGVSYTYIIEVELWTQVDSEWSTF